MYPVDTNYIELKAGDVRKKGDEQREKGYQWNNPYGPKMVPPKPWKDACLVGHAILGADLLHLDFRRAVK